MNNTGLLKITSLLSLLLLTLHVTDDIVRGISKAESSNTALVVLVVLLYGTLVLAEGRWGHVIMFLVGLLAAAIPVMHMRGAHYPEIATSTGGFFFVWTLWALGTARGRHHDPLGAWPVEPATGRHTRLNAPSVPFGRQRPLVGPQQVLPTDDPHQPIPA